MATTEAYVKAQNGAVRLAVRALRRFWASLDLGDPFAVRDALESSFWPDLLATYGELTAALAADRFEDLTGLPAKMVRPVDAERANARMRWAISPLFDGAGDALARLEVLVDELVKQPGRSTMLRSARENGVAFVRVLSGPDACEWCVEMSTAAQDPAVFHGACDCRIDPAP